MRYSDFANDLVLSDILSYLLFSESHKVPFLNNANMENISSSLKRLIVDIEKEMDQVREEREKIQRYKGARASAKKLDIDPQKYFANMLKRSKFQKNLQVSHRHKLSMPDLQRTRSPFQSKSQRYHLKKQ